MRKICDCTDYSGIVHVFPLHHSGPCVWQLKQTSWHCTRSFMLLALQSFVFVSLFKLQMVQNFILVQITKRFPNKADNCLIHFHPVFKTWSSHFKNYKRQSFRSGKLESSDLRHKCSVRKAKIC